MRPYKCVMPRSVSLIRRHSVTGASHPTSLASSARVLRTRSVILSWVLRRFRSTHCLRKQSALHSADNSCRTRDHAHGRMQCAPTGNLLDVLASGKSGSPRPLEVISSQPTRNINHFTNKIEPWHFA